MRAGIEKEVINMAYIRLEALIEGEVDRFRIHLERKVAEAARERKLVHRNGPKEIMDPNDWKTLTKSLKIEALYENN